MIASGHKAWLNRVFLMNPIAVWFGLISYPLYLWHWPILSYLQIVEGEIPHRDARISAVILSVFFAWLTFKYVERPIRKQSRLAPRAIHLILILAIVGTSALYVSQKDGIPNRKAIVEYEANLDELQRTIAIDSMCLSYLELLESKFNYCKISSIGFKGVVAIIGDSHAHAAFPGISEGLSKLGYTTILLANSSCPPLLGSAWGRNKGEKQLCSERVEQIISKVLHIDNLQNVIIFTRGPGYWIGNQYHLAPKETEPSLTLQTYFEGLQRTLDAFEAKNIGTFYVIENPELKYDARACLPRPFNASVSKRCEQDLDIVLERQKDYREQLGKLNNVILVDSIEAFCDSSSNKCFAVSPQNKLLYTDDDHVSVEGSIWQYEKLIKPYFDN